MIDKSKDARNQSEKLLRLLKKTTATEQDQWKKDATALFHEMHLRLTLLEGADPRLLADTSF